MRGLAPLPYRSGPVVWLLVIIATCLILFLFQKVLWLVVPFVLALVMYYAWLPLKMKLVLSGFSHDVAATGISLVVGVLTVAGLVLSLPWVTVDADNWQASVSRYVDGGIHFFVLLLAELEARFPGLARFNMSQEFAGRIADFASAFVSDHLAEALLGLAAWTPSLLLAPFLAFFMLRDGWRFKKFIGRAVSNAFFERTLCLLDQLDRTARAYFLGLLQLTVLDAAVLGGGLWLLGVSAPLLLGVVTAILAWVPYLGSLAGCLLVVLVAATDYPAQPQVAYGAIALFLAVRLLDDFVFMPLTVGKSLKVHPLLTVLMIFVGGAVAGVPGLMLVLPVLGMVMVCGETIGLLLTDARLRARHQHATRLRRELAAADL